MCACRRILTRKRRTYHRGHDLLPKGLLILTDGLAVAPGLPVDRFLPVAVIGGMGLRHMCNLVVALLFARLPFRRGCGAALGAPAAWR